MRPPRWTPLVEKSIAACCAAIEIYNKPVSPHREETFAILVVSAWELLLKARLVRENNNRLDAIFETESIPRKDGLPSRKRRVVKNRSGNQKTISLGAALHSTGALATKPLPAACRENLLLLTEVRDNGIHFVNSDRDLAQRVHEIGTASLVNYAATLAEWFDRDLGSHRFSILPLSFEPASAAKAVPPRRSRQAANLLAHMERTCHEQAALDTGRFAVSLRVETRIVGSQTAGAVPIKLGKGVDAAKVELTEDEFRRRWPLDYAALVKQLAKLIPGFKQDKRFHAAKRARCRDERFAKDRLLDFNNPKSTKKTYYSQAMLDVLVVELRDSATIKLTAA